MKLTKKSMTVLSFTIGACVFVSTAFADALLGSGYDMLKTSAKNTAAQMEKGLDSYTLEGLFTLKDNGQMLMQATNVSKIEVQKKAEEQTNTTQDASGKATSHYSYSDSKMSVWKSTGEDKYYVTEFPEDVHRGERKPFTNPFNENGAAEVEKIVDAIVGNLKDYVQAEDGPNGGKVYSGSLSEAQVPAIVNAVSSFGMKQMIRDQGRGMSDDTKLPQIESDIYVKKVVGTAVENKAGLLESVTGDFVLTGKDKNGAEHELSLTAVVKLSNINATKITLPDLTGASVEKMSNAGGFSSKYVGTYKNNVIIEKDGKFVKIGERTLNITSVEQNKVAGTYSETVKPGYEADYGQAVSFSFEYNPSSDKGMPTFSYTNAKGEQLFGQLHPNGMGKIYVELNLEKRDDNSYTSKARPMYMDGEFSRVFE